MRLSILGYGAGHIGGENDNEENVEYILNHALDCGINLIDTARGYGKSEERIGKYVSSHRRHDAILCTKVGYGIDGVEDWTYDCIIKGVERALFMMKTDYLDIVLLHTCPKWMLERYDVVRALENVKSRGLVRAIGYSGDNEDLEFAVHLDALDCYEGSFNLFDQKKAEWVLSKIKNDNKCFIAKRPVGNAPWRFQERPSGHYCEQYWDRMKTLDLPSYSLDMTELAMRYTAFTDGITSCITGTTTAKHLDENIAIIENGPISESIYNEIRDIYRQRSADWRSEV